MPEVLSCLLIYIPAVRRGGVLPVLFSSLVETISVIGLKRRVWQRLACSDHHSTEGRVGLYRVFSLTSHLRPLRLWHQIPLMPNVWKSQGLFFFLFRVTEPGFFPPSVFGLLWLLRATPDSYIFQLELQESRRHRRQRPSSVRVFWLLLSSALSLFDHVVSEKWSCFQLSD